MRRSKPFAVGRWPIALSRQHSALSAGVLVLMALLLLAGVALADGGYEIAWFSIDAGGGDSAGGGYTLTGSAGQPDAQTLSGGGYTLTGGFWAGAGPLYFRYLPVVMKD